jgi:aspartyl-tRNA(Asn)/glutamyl-tRNA(Gln) amidotransferase subunit C
LPVAGAARSGIFDQQILKFSPRKPLEHRYLALLLFPAGKEVFMKRLWVLALYQREGFRARRKCDNFSARFGKIRFFLTLFDLFNTRLSVDVFFGVNPTMAVDRSDIAKLAELARLAISENTADEVARSISDVLALVDQLQAVNTDGVAPMAHPLDAIQRLRADVVTEPDQRARFQAIAPATQDGLYLVPQVID